MTKILLKVLSIGSVLSYNTLLHSRRVLIGGFASGAALLTTDVLAAETIGKDPSCNDSLCLGVWDGLLADCPHGGRSFSGCTSSQDDTPGIFSEPWDYSEAASLRYEDQMDRLVSLLQLQMTKILVQEGRYLRVAFGEAAIGEFYFTPNDTTVQFRIEANPKSGLSTKSIERAERIRKELKYDKLPVLRNRKRSLFFVESDLDTFGPGSAALGPPAEMRTGELEGRQDVSPKLKIDLVQQFPARPS